MDYPTPDPGTKCAQCGGCPATILAAGEPLCWECDEGKPCACKKAGEMREKLTATDKRVDKVSMTAARVLRKKPGPKAGSKRKAPETALPDLRTPFDRDEFADLPANAREQMREVLASAEVAAGESVMRFITRREVHQELVLHYHAVIRHLEASVAELEREADTLRRTIGDLKALSIAIPLEATAP